MKVVSRIELLIISEDVIRACFVVIIFYLYFVFCVVIAFAGTRVLVVRAWLCLDDRDLLDRPLQQLLQP